jgi:hypothetical protein
VDGIEREYEGELEVIRINVQDPVGIALGDRLRFEYTPTFIFFDAEGNELWRNIGAINPQDVREAMEAAGSGT